MSVLTAEQLMLKFRREVADTLEGVSTSEPDSENLWKNVEIYGYMNEAQHRWAEETLALQKTFTVAIPANTQHVKLPSRILNVRTVHLLGNVSNGITNGRRLVERNLLEANVGYRDYGYTPNAFTPIILGTRVAAPSFYSLDVMSGYMTLDSMQTTADSMQIYASALPMTNIDSAGVVDCSDPTDQRLVLHFMKSLAYSKQDADTYDLARSVEFEKRFEREALHRAAQFLQRRRRAGTTRYCGV